LHHLIIRKCISANQNICLKVHPSTNSGHEEVSINLFSSWIQQMLGFSLSWLSPDLIVLLWILKN
jgi:hypothetical protein